MVFVLVSGIDISAVRASQIIVTNAKLWCIRLQLTRPRLVVYIFFYFVAEASGSSANDFISHAAAITSHYIKLTHCHFQVKEPKQTSNKPNETNHEKITVRRNLFSGSPVKRKRRNSTCGTGLKSPRRIKNNPPKVVERTPKRDKINASRRKAATTPKGKSVFLDFEAASKIPNCIFVPTGRHVLKTMFVPATPEHKEGSLGVLRRQQRLHRRTLSKDAHEIVEESPDKAYKAGKVSFSFPFKCTTPRLHLYPCRS